MGDIFSDTMHCDFNKILFAFSKFANTKRGRTGTQISSQSLAVKAAQYLN